MKRVAFAAALVATLIGARPVGADGILGAGASGTSTGGVVTVDYTQDGGPGGGYGGSNPCTYEVVSFTDVQLILAGVSLRPPQADVDPEYADTEWVVVRCPDDAGAITISDIYQFDAGAPPIALLIAQAERELVVPFPEAVTSPPSTAFAIVGTETWVWLDPAEWVAREATACLPGACATIVATPIELRIAMGDGTTLTCVGPGRAYDRSVSYASQADATDRCAHVYIEDSAALAGGRYGVVATTVWARQWTCATPAGSCGGGPMAPLELIGPATPLEVREYQAVTN